MHPRHAPGHPSLYDSHCHLNDPRFDADRDEVVARALAAGVTRMLVAGYDVGSSERAAALAAVHPHCLASAGVHPHDARHYSPEARAALTALAATAGVVAIGEIGLDFHYNHSPPDVQRAAFRDQLDLARQLDLPVVLHCREAYDELLDTLVAVGAGGRRGVLHCFGGNAEQARRGLDLGFCLGFGGVVTFRKADDVREVVRQTPLDRLLVESDAPYLAPEPHRGKRNEPGHVALVAQRVAEIHGVPAERVADVTTSAAHALFGTGARLQNVS